MSNTRHANPPADGQVQTLRALWLKRQMVALALAADTNGLGALAEQYQGNPVVLGSAACLLAQDLAALTEKSAAALAAISFGAYGLAAGD